MSNVYIVFSARPTQTGPARHYKVTDMQYRQLKTDILWLAVESAKSRNASLTPRSVCCAAGCWSMGGRWMQAEFNIGLPTDGPGHTRAVLAASSRNRAVVNCCYLTELAGRGSGSGTVLYSVLIAVLLPCVL